MKLLQLRCFVAAYEEGSLSAAAVRLNATQPGLSMRIRDLEARYGTRLFERSSSGVVATEQGRRLYTRAVQILHAVSQADDELRNTRDAIAGSVQVGLIPTFTRSVAPAALIRMRTEYPLVTVMVKEAFSDILSEDTEKGLLDFAIVPAFQEKPALVSTLIGVDQEYLARAAGSNPPIAKFVRLADMAPLHLILPTRANARRGRIDAYLADHGIAVAQIFELNAMLGTLEMIARSHWMTILPGILCMADSDGMHRWAAPISDPPLPVSYFRIEPAQQALSAAASAFAGILQQELEVALEITQMQSHQKSGY